LQDFDYLVASHKTITTAPEGAAHAEWRSPLCLRFVNPANGGSDVEVQRIGELAELHDGDAVLRKRRST
jgi:hypothetical protein